MQIYILIACDGLEEKQEKKLKKNLPDLLLALQAYGDTHPQAKVTLINECGFDEDKDDSIEDESDDSCEESSCEDWQLGIEQSLTKSKQLQAPINFFNDLAKKYGIDMEIGKVSKKKKREAVSYFGASEGRGDSFMISQYLDV